MKFIKVSDECFYFSSAVNIGYIKKDGKGLLIDSGIDKSTMKKVCNELNENKFPLDYLIITHAHADHFGGGHYIKSTLNLPIFAPALEAAIIENPVLEPIYLWNGAFPLSELRNKFLEGKAVKVDHFIHEGKLEIGPFGLEVLSLPGHSYGQIGILFQGILYAADSYFGMAALDKHVVPFITDLKEALSTLKYLSEFPCQGSIPGHGPFEEDFHLTIQQNINVHNKQLATLEGLIQKYTSIPFEKLLSRFLDVNDLNVNNIGQLLLFRTTFTAYLTYLMEQKTINLCVKNNHLMVEW
ncbi:glyoxylase-like metal-dependent hydrolase (beta-lactamase superfamily II) [Bacillus pakistanensis]|uniref:Glyoxylase-like metal-dependent hydrolase (Beta-lactamase superfamily II) n=1 Tax=Rossellomorea pakistanensis TaxID=992288 RepID=A0ABS2NFD4_9BACI|nr:MBL fold metallo-hydrolase [Bacillus pakistanensis]MBM7586559.1 glyoxylase-like metal-dependent hydrolase (beta-lactamase superfamily II) [Bacillus pakistanensis]